MNKDKIYDAYKDQSASRQKYILAFATFLFGVVCGYIGAWF